MTDAASPQERPRNKLPAFFAPHCQLDPAHWGHARKTSGKSWAQRQEDRWSSFGFPRFCA